MQLPDNVYHTCVYAKSASWFRFDVRFPAYSLAGMCVGCCGAVCKSLNITHKFIAAHQLLGVPEFLD